MEATRKLNSDGQSIGLDSAPESEGAASWRDLKLQIMSSSVISFSMVHAGMTVSFPNLLNKKLGKDISSSYASLSALATPLGSLVTSLLTDRIGRKRTLITLELLSVFSWLMVALAESSELLFYSSSFFLGMTRGALTSHSSTYISEITHGDYRQMLLSLTTVFFSLGYTATSGANLMFSWTEAGLIFAILFSILCALVVALVPESPHWLAVMRLDLKRAQDTMKKLNPEHAMFEKEWTLLQQKLDKRTKPGTTRFGLLWQPNVYKPSCILIVLLLFQQFCGIYPLSAYTMYVLPKVSSTLGLKYTSEIFVAIGIIRLVISVITTLFLSKFNQKQLLSFSAIGMLLLAFPLAGVKAFAGDQDGIQPTDWILVICLIAYTAVSCVGAVGIPWTIIFELLPTEVRGLLGPYFVALGYLVMSGLLRIFLTALDIMGVVNMFIFFGLVSLAGSFFIHFCVPETRGKSLYEIENRFSEDKKTEANC